MALARRVAARSGDPNPELIQHARGSRFDVNADDGIEGVQRRPVLHRRDEGQIPSGRTARPGARPTDEQFVSYPFQIVVIDVETGKITDSGSIQSGLPT